jgi:SAM-dependent methyltransferase
MKNSVRSHYEQYPYPQYPLLASVRRCDGYAINLTALWTAFNGELPPAEADRILLAGCGSFAPYPFSVSNPDSKITALDLSGKSLRRARLHCLLHGRRNISFQCGDLLDATVAPGPFWLIDVYGVIHHLDDPLSGLASLANRLAPGGIIRLMVYSRYARREEESIRRALRFLRIEDPDSVRSLARRAADGSRFKKYFDDSYEATFEAGLADALLHPCVKTYRIDEVLDLVRNAGLGLLRFAHDGALEDIEQEIERIRLLESERKSAGNFLVYLGKGVKGPCREDHKTFLILNPCLTGVVGFQNVGSLSIVPRLGCDNMTLGWQERRFLSRFRKPVRLDSLSEDTRIEVQQYVNLLFLLKFHL